jgi:hypothetical protein
MNQQHWSQRLHDVLNANEKPSYELLEESVHGLLQERQGLINTVTDLGKKLCGIVFARMNGNTEQALTLLDDVIEHNVSLMAKPAETAAH